MLRVVFQLRKICRKINVARKVHVKKSCNKELVAQPLDGAGVVPEPSLALESELLQER